ncbi:hypothetical protein KR018_007620 [Drosophila ironensis]|nr:hypothetical protein KR018_007620 [Drosophila ironensis]
MVQPSLSGFIRNTIKCTEGSVQADSDNCASYFQCLDEATLHLRCPDGSYFEDNNQVCVVDELGVCPASSTKTCIEGQVEVDAGDCAGYLECVNGVLVKESCPSGSYFDSTLTLCVIDADGICSNTTDLCTDGDLTANPNNCAGYLNCVNGQAVSINCPSGSYFEPILKICIIDINGVCVEPPAQCTEGQVKLDPNNCAGYLKCTNGEYVEELCPSGSYFNPNLDACLVDSEGVCLAKRTLCVEGVREKDPRNCAGYTQCIQGEIVKKTCPAGRYFNVKKKDCLIDTDQVCVKSFTLKDTGKQSLTPNSSAKKKNICRCKG